MDGRSGLSRRRFLTGAGTVVAAGAVALACSTSGPGTIPPPGSITG